MEKKTEQTELGYKEKVKVKEPNLYKVVMHNDNVTTMEFVVELLMTLFKKSENEAVKLMLTIHNSGLAEVGVYPSDVAKSLCATAISIARKNNFPLLVTVEPKES